MKKFLTLSALLVLCFAMNCKAEKLSFKEDTNYAIDYHSSQKSQTPLLVDDEVQSLKWMKNETENWQRKEEYFRNWNLEDTGIYQNTEDNKEKIITKSFIRYAERRSQDLFRKKKHNDSKLNTYGLRTIGENYNDKLEENRYRFRVSSTPTRGRVRLILENPFVELYGQYAIGSKDEIGMSRLFNELKVKLSLVHSPLRQKTTFVTEKFITENLIAKYTDSNFLNRKIELLYNYSF